MKILALDSTADIGSVAICDDGKLICEITVNTGNTHSESLLPAVEQALKLAGLCVDDIDLFACSTGPGSFTGVRIGVATIKGLAYGKNKPCVSVSTLEALAQNLIGYNGIICPVMNARRNQVYNALFRISDGVIERICRDRAIAIADLDCELKNYTLPLYLCGDGYDITVKNSTLTNYGYVGDREKLQSAYSVARCAFRKFQGGDFVTDATLVPIYLRPSQAERERLERLKANESTGDN